MRQKKPQKELESKELETVKITGSDGVELIGHFYPCRNSRRVIIAFHGWRSSWLYDYGLISVSGIKRLQHTVC